MMINRGYIFVVVSIIISASLPINASNKFKFKNLTEEFQIYEVIDSAIFHIADSVFMSNYEEKELRNKFFWIYSVKNSKYAIFRTEAPDSIDTVHLTGDSIAVFVMLNEAPMGDIYIPYNNHNYFYSIIDEDWGLYIPDFLKKTTRKKKLSFVAKITSVYHPVVIITLYKNRMLHYKFYKKDRQLDDL